MKKKIPLFRPSITKKELVSVEKTLKSGYITLGPKTKQFEKEFSKFVGAPFSIATSSWTVGAQMALHLLNIKNTEVCVPAITFIATAAAAVYNQARPVFVDIDPDTLCMSCEDLARKTSKKTSLIMPVHYGGHPCDMNKIVQIAKKNGLYIVEDCAHAPGSYYKEKHVGSFGDFGVFSFQAVKPLTTGDGGMVVTKDKAAAEKLKRLRWFGANKGTHDRDLTTKGNFWSYRIQDLGFKGYMNDIAAALGLAQLKRQEAMKQKRKKIVRAYNQAFKNVEWIKTPRIESYADSSYHNYHIQIDSTRIERPDFIAYLEKNGITAGVHYMPLYLHPYFKGLGAKCPIADEVWRRIVLLPVFPDMKDSEIEKVIDKVKSYQR